MTKETVIGVDLGATKVSLGKVKSGRISKHISAAVSARGSQKQVLGEIIRAMERISDRNVAGIGIGVPSVVDVEKGIVYDVQNIPSWKKVPLKEVLEKQFRRPVFINNDANCFAVGEKYFGKGKIFRHFVGVTLGSGLGAGIIINSKLYSGPNCGAGEFGMMPYKNSILEHYASGQFFSREHGLSGELVYRRAERGERKARDIFKQFGTHLGDAMMMIMLAVDPEAIIIGGSVSRAFPFFEKAMRERMRIFPYQRALRRLVIKRSSQPHIAVLGAAALTYDAQ